MASRRRPWQLSGLVLALAGCAPDNPSVQISASGAGAFEVSLAIADGVLATAWFDTRDGNAEIYAHLIDGVEPRSGTDLRLTDTAPDSYVPDVALLSSDLVVAWFEKPDGGRETAYVGRWSADGEPLWQRPLDFGATEGRNPLLLTLDERLFVAWVAKETDGQRVVVARWLDGTGEYVGEPMSLGSGSEQTWNLNGTIDGQGRVLLVFDAQHATASDEVYLAELAGPRLRTRRLTADDGFASKYPDIAIGPSGTVISWQDERDGNTEVYLYASPTGEIPAEIDGASRRITATPGHSIGAYVAARPDGFGLAWCDDSNGSYDLFFQGFAADGAPAGEPQRLHAAASDSLIPAIVPTRSGFAIAWNELRRGQRGYHGPDTRSEILFLTLP